MTTWKVFFFARVSGGRKRTTVSIQLSQLTIVPMSAQFLHLTKQVANGSTSRGKGVFELVRCLAYQLVDQTDKLVCLVAYGFTVLFYYDRIQNFWIFSAYHKIGNNRIIESLHEFPFRNQYPCT